MSNILISETDWETVWDIIAHYGIKGMEWGVRRDRRTLAKAAKRSREMKDQAALNRSEAAEYEKRAAGHTAKTQANLRKSIDDDKAQLDVLREEADHYEKTGKALIEKGGRFNKLRGTDNVVTANVMRDEAGRLEAKIAKREKALADGGGKGLRNKILSKSDSATAKELRTEAKENDRIAKEQGAKASAAKARIRKAEAALKAADVKNMSNKDLQTHITRMNLEKQYSQLTTERASTSRLSRGKGAVEKAVKDAGQDVMKAYIKREMATTVNVVDTLVRAQVKNRTGG